MAKICDLCKNSVNDLVPLLDTYATKDIKEICTPCEAMVNDHLYKIRALNRNMTTTMLQRFMEILKK